MGFIGETEGTGGQEPVVVRVKRKSWQSRLDGLWLEINQRPLKRPLLNFNKLTIDDANHGKVEELKSVKVFVQHVETVDASETTDDFVQSLIVSDSKPEELLCNGWKDQEALAQNARFEQIWRSRRGKKEPLNDMYHFYDVVRVHDEEGSIGVQEQEAASLEDQKILRSHLPIPREFIPSAVAEIESDIYAYLFEQGYQLMPRSIADIESDIHAYLYEQDDYVYDYYTIKKDTDIGEQDAISLFPVVQVEDDDDDDDFYEGPDNESEYDSDDSNAEAHPENDYPDETSEDEIAASTDKEEEGEDEKDDGANTPKEEEEETENANSVSSEFEDLRLALAQDAVPSHDDEIYDNFDYMDINEDLREMNINEDLPDMNVNEDL